MFDSYSLAVIDLDNTLYAANNGVFARMDKRMTGFIAEHVGISEDAANTLRMNYWREYGTTLRGLMLHHGIEPEAFLIYVHDIDAHEILTRDPELDRALSSMHCRKVIHTNGTREHAECILQTLGLRHHFSAIYDIRFNDYLPKPCATTLGHLIAQEGILAEHTIVIDDMAENLVAAQSIGAGTCLISENGAAPFTWDFQAPSLPDLIRL